MFDWILPFVCVLGLLVFVHELGHFIAAKRSGVRVEKFSLGFPPNLFKKKIGDTEYCIGIIPLGGYVRMKGDIPDFADDKTAPAGDPDEFMSAPAWKRAIIIAAGPVMNFVAAFLLFVIMFWAWGNPLPRPESTEIGSVGQDTPAYQAGLKEGDVILSIDDTPVSDFQQMAEYIKSRPDQDIVFRFHRDGGDQTLTLHTLKYEFIDGAGVEKIEGRIGVDPVFDFHPTNLLLALKDGATATVFISAVTFEFIWKLISREESVKNLGGPIMIADQAGKALRRGLPYLVNLAAFLSINLGILNILPIPVLDGGHLVFLGIEGIRRRPIPFKKRLFWQQVGMGLLLLLMVFVTYNDILRLFTDG
jgi:regulator of sigma E protease